MEKKKKASGVQLLVRLVVKKPDGKVLSDTGYNPSKSFVIQFLEAVWAMFSKMHVYATSTGNTEEYLIYGTVVGGEDFRLNAPANDDTNGIIVGTGDTPVDNEDYKLATQLTEGVGAGNITHGAQVQGVAGVVGGNVDWECSRIFTNNTGSTITIKEVGEYTYYHVKEPYSSHCIIRDVLGTPVEVPDNCSVTVYYTWRTTV